MLNIFTYFYNGDNYINNYIKHLDSIINIELNRIIIFNITDSNLNKTNNKLLFYSSNKNYVKLIQKKKSDNYNKSKSINYVLENLENGFFLNYNIYDKINKNIIIIFENELNKDNKIKLLYSYLNVFNKKNNKIIKEKKVFYNENFIDNYNYKLNLLKKYLDKKENIYKLKNKYIEIKKFDIFDFFFIDKNNLLDLNNYYLFDFIGQSSIIDINLIKKKKLNEELDNMSFLNFYIELYLESYKFKCINKYLVKHNKYDYSFRNDYKRRFIIKKYHPIFKLILTDFDVVIPYRNREKEFKIFFNNLFNSFKIYFEYRIILCIQDNLKDFKRSIINYGVEHSKKSHILITDIDILYKKIPFSLIIKKNNLNFIKIYGSNKFKFSIGGGSLLINYENFKLLNGFSDKYSKWGCEDIDFTYRLFFNNIKIDNEYVIYREDKNDYIEELRSSNKITDFNYNNIIFIQQIINYNILFFLNNKNKFKKVNNDYYYKDYKFLEILDYNDNKNIFYGNLYDILFTNKEYRENIKNNKIYSGMFVYFLPNGIGKCFFIWNNFSIYSLWLNGYIRNKKLIKDYILKEKVNTYSIIDKDTIIKKIININIKRKFDIYQKYVYSGFNNITKYCKINKKKNIYNIQIIYLKIDI